MKLWTPNKPDLLLPRWQSCRLITLSFTALLLWPMACLGEEGADHLTPPECATDSLPLLNLHDDMIDSPSCTTSWPTGEKIADLDDPRANESSGLAMSSYHQDLFWSHNDSGDAPRLYVFDTNGQVLTDVILPVTHVDWEDLAIGPCSPNQPHNRCVYVADIGDNESVRSHVTIYRFPEPHLACRPDEYVIDSVDTLHVRYPEGARDAEALLVHPLTAQIWVVEKTGNEEATIFEIPANFNHPEITEALPIAALPTPGPFNLARSITAGDISPDGSEFTLRSYLQLYTFCVPADAPFEAAFQSSPNVQTALPALIQSEALTYDRRSLGLWLTSERLPTPLIRIAPPPLPEETP